ncbi:autotransporter-associated beta strand repeat-containing protein [uncultured Alsobacter sp.]|uniref:autotransporter-associated beta strand repeat-containing protein n=1 Tax=uncultured Alsobacter sp. TaxID=1748258 RepID=UPI0025F96ABA|nr:autotransporter-associated beta strand repeat-containing protein [uncultured Alsobacter sp.]
MLTIENATNFLLASAIQNGGTLNKAGDGTLTLSGAMTGSGTVNVQKGILRAATNASSAFGANQFYVLSDDTTLDLNGTNGTIGALSGTGLVDNSAATDATLTVGGSGASTTFTGVIGNSGAGKLTLKKTGAGTLELAPAVPGGNTFSGDVLVTDGTLAISSVSALGTGSTLTLGGTSGGNTAGALSYTGTDTATSSRATVVQGSGGKISIAETAASLTFTGAVTGSVLLAKDGQGTLTLSSQNNALTGGVSLRGGSLVLSAGNYRGEDRPLVSGGADGLTGGSGVTASSYASLTVGGTVRGGKGGDSAGWGDSGRGGVGIDATGGSITVSAGGRVEGGDAGAVSEGGTLGGGVGISGQAVAVDLSGTVSGGLFGAIRANAFSFQGGGNSLTIRSGAVINGGIGLQSGASLTVTNAGAFTLSSIDGGGALTKTGAGNLVLSGANTFFSGTVRVTEGTLTAGNAGALGASNAVTLETASTLDLNGNALTVASLAGAGTVTNSGTADKVLTLAGSASTDFAGSINDGISGKTGFTKSGTGTLTLKGVNTYTGATTVANGTLELATGGSIAAASTVTLTGGTLRIAADNTTASLANVRIGNGGGTATVDLQAARAFTWSGPLGPDSKSLTITGAATGAASRIVSFGDSSTNWSAYGGTLRVGNTTLQLKGGTVGAAGMSTVIDDGGTLGGVGRLGGSVEIKAGGTLAAASTGGPLALGGSLTLTQDSRSLFTLGAPGFVGSDGQKSNTLVTVGGDLNLAGTLVLRSAIDTDLLAPGYYRLFNYGGTRTGTFGIISVEGGATGDTAVVYYSVNNQVNLLYTRGGDSVLFFTGGDKQGNTSTQPGSGPPSGGSGTWSNKDTNWTTAPLDATTGSPGSDIRTGWRPGFAVFGGGGTGTKTVTMTSNAGLQVKGLHFVTDGYVIESEDETSLNLISDGLSLSAPVGVVTVDTGLTATINAVLANDPGDRVGLRKAGEGTLILGGYGGYAGVTRLEKGILAINSASALVGTSGITFAGGTLRIDAGAAGSTFDRPITLASAGTIDTNGRDFGLSGTLGGLRTLTKTGDGTLSLAGSSADFAGGIVIARGTLSAASAGALGKGTGESAGRNTITLAGGQFSATASFDTGVNVFVAAADTQAPQRRIAVSNGITLGLTGTVSGAGTLEKTGAGTLALSGGNGTFAGGFLITQGTVSASSAAALGNGSATDLASRNVLTLNGGRLLATDTITSGVGVVMQAASIIEAASGKTLTLTGSFTGAGQLTIKGDVVLSGTALTNYEGNFSVTGMTQVAAGSRYGSGSQTVTVDTGASLNVNGTVDAAVNVSGTLSGAGTITKAVAIGAGGGLSAGNSPGTLRFESTLSLDAGATTTFELGSPGSVGTSGTVRNDLVAVAGALTLGGALVLKGDGTNQPTSGYYRLFNYGTLTAGSSFSSVKDGAGADLSPATAKVLTNVANQVNLLYRAGGQSVLFFTGANNTLGNTGSAPGSVAPAGGSGTWSTAATQWTTAPVGPDGKAPAAGATGTSPGSDINDGWNQGVAVFSGTTGGTVTVTGPVSFEGIQFVTSGYTISGGALSLAGNAPGGRPQASFVRTDASVTATIGSVLQENFGLDKTGGGTLILTAANTFTGAVTVEGGTLVAANNAALGNAANAVTLKAGTTLKAGDGLTALALGQSITLDGAATLDTNGKTVTLSGALAKGGSGGTLTVTGGGTLTLTGNSSGFGGLVDVSGANLTLQAGSRLQVDRIAVAQGRQLLNAGRLTGTGASIVNGGTLTTIGSLVDATDIVNTAGAVLNASGVLSAPLVDNQGTFNVTGALSGRDTAAGSPYTGPIASFLNGGTLNLGGNTVTDVGVLTNTGIVRGGGALPGTTLAGTGIVDLRPGGTAGLAQDATLSLTIGQLTGNQTVKVALDPAAGTAGKIIATGSTAGSSLTFLIVQSSLRPTSAPVTLAQGLGSGTTVTASADTGATLDSGFVQTTLRNPSPGLWQLTTTVSPNAGAPAASIGSVITSLSTGFFSSTNAFVASPTDKAPNTRHGGPWVRIQAGQYDSQADTAVSYGSLSARSVTKVRTSFSGFQVGADYGVLNIAGTGFNLHGGVTAGSVTANAGQQASATPTKGAFSVPFVGAYAALIKGAFSADLQYRHDFYTMDVTNPVGFTGTLSRQKAEGDSVNGSAAYRFAMSETAFVEPSVGFNYTRVDVDPFKAAQGGAAGVKAGSITLDRIDSLLGRASLRVGFTTVVDDKVVLQPFATAAVWREFADDAKSAFTFSGSGEKVTIKTGRVGTFGQAGLGVTGQVIGTNLLGYIRTDARFGDRIRGGSINMGIRYDF